MSKAKPTPNDGKQLPVGPQLPAIPPTKVNPKPVSPKISNPGPFR